MRISFLERVFNRPKDVWSSLQPFKDRWPILEALCFGVHSITSSRTRLHIPADRSDLRTVGRDAFHSRLAGHKVETIVTTTAVQTYDIYSRLPEVISKNRSHWAWRYGSVNP